MESNKLSFRVEEEIESTFPGLWIELLIDEKSVNYLAEIDCRTIPQVYFDDCEIDLPKPTDSYQNRKTHLFGVCSCGIDGCGSAVCEIEKNDDFVKLKIIAPKEFESSTNNQFKFSRKNYESVIGEIKKQIKEYNESQTSLR